MLVLTRQTVTYNGITLAVELMPIDDGFIAEQVGAAAVAKCKAAKALFEAGDLQRVSGEPAGVSTGIGLMRMAIRMLLSHTRGRPFAVVCTARHARAYCALVTAEVIQEGLRVRSDDDCLVVVRGPEPRCVRSSCEV